MAFGVRIIEDVLRGRERVDDCLFMKNLIMGLMLVGNAIVLMVGCEGNDDAASAIPFQSNLPNAKKLTALSDEEAQQLCDETAVYVSVLREHGCRVSAAWAALTLANTDANVSDSQLQAECRSRYVECLAAPVDSQPSRCEKVEASCTATIAEYEACISETGQVYFFMASIVPECSEITRQRMPFEDSPSKHPPTGEACENLRRKCPSPPH